MRKRISAELSIRSCFLTLLLLSVGAFDAQSKQDFPFSMNDAQRAWEEYRRFGQRLQGTYATQAASEDKQGSRVRSQIRRNENCSLLLSESLESTAPSFKGPTARVTAINPVYSFVLSRNGSAGPWILTTLQLRTDGIPPEIEQVLAPSREPTPVLLTAHGESLFKLIQQPNFRLLGASLVQHHDEELVKLEFDNSHPMTSGSKFFPIQGGSLILDPKRFWCVRAWDVRAKHLGTRVHSKAEIELRDPLMKFPIPSRLVETRSVQADNPADQSRVGYGGRWVREMDLSDPSSPPPDEEFTLTAFGLPEPPGVEWPKPTPWWLYVAGGAIGLIVLGALLAWVKQRWFVTP